MARVLIIDDNEVIRSMLRMMLEEGGHKVTEAANGLEGTDRFRNNPTEVVITDIFMPEKEGTAVIRDLHATAPNVKIIAISGGSGDLADPSDYLNLAKRFGAHATLNKPFQIDELLGTVDRLLAGVES